MKGFVNVKFLKRFDIQLKRILLKFGGCLIFHHYQKGMEIQKKHKKFWKPPSFEDFNTATPTKKLRLDSDNFFEEVLSEIPNEAAEPKTVTELAAHPKKIEEVRNWMKFSSNLQAPILLVTGPAGCGKTTTIKVAANAEGFSIKEWINPINKIEFKTEQCNTYDRFNFYESKQTDKFEDFVFKCSRYVSLFEDNKKTLILVEDIPNVFIWKPKHFFEFLEKYKAIGKSPLIFIVTDDQNLNLQNDLFPPNIKNKHNITNIKFNPVNNSLLMKSLRHLTELYCSEKVSPVFLENICKNSGGDIRSAVNDLLLFLRTNEQNLSHLPKVVRKKNKKNEGVWAACKSVTSKDSSFDFYHLIGRILYPKTLSESEKSPENLNRRFVHDVHQIADNFTNNCLNVLHENYLQTVGKFSDIVKCSEIFCNCDILGNYPELEGYKNLYGVIGLMSSNSEPKKSGFNPMKKPFHLSSKKFKREVETEMELLNLKFSERNLLLDVVPFMKVIEQKEPSRIKIEMEKDEFESDEDLIEIEEFDD